MHNVIHCKDWKTCINQRSGQWGLPTTDFYSKRLLRWHWHWKWRMLRWNFFLLRRFGWCWIIAWARHLSPLGVTALMVWLGLMAALFVAKMQSTLAAGPDPQYPQIPLLNAKDNGFPSGIFATHPWGISIEPCFVLDFPLLLPLPLPFWYLLRRSDASDADLLSGFGVLLGAVRTGMGIRYGMSWGEVRRALISLSSGVIADPGSDCRWPTKLLEARMNICLSHSMICCNVTEANPEGCALSCDKNRCCTHISISLKEQSLAWSIASDRRWRAFLRSNSELTVQVVEAALELILMLPLASSDTLESRFKLCISWDLDVHSSGLIHAKTFCSSIFTQRSTNAWLGVTSGENMMPSSLVSCSTWRVWRSAIGNFLVANWGSEGWSTFLSKSFSANAWDSTTSRRMQEVWNGLNSLLVTFNNQASKIASVICWGVVVTANAKDPNVSNPFPCSSPLSSSSTPSCLILSAKAALLSRADMAELTIYVRRWWTYWFVIILTNKKSEMFTFRGQNSDWLYQELAPASIWSSEVSATRVLRPDAALNVFRFSFLTTDTREALLSEAGFEKVFRTQNWVRRRKLFCRWFGFLLGQAGCISVAAWTQLKVAFYYFVSSGGLIVCC